MKKYLILSLLLFLPSLRLAACGYMPGTYNYYMFCVQDHALTPAPTDVDAYWTTYSKGKTEGYEAEELQAIARQRGDRETLAYITLLEQYLQAVGDADDPWSYPTEAELAARAKLLEAVRTKAAAYRGTRYKSRYALLLMRANMALKRYADNVSYWEKRASRLIASPLRNRMEGLYAAALLRTGKRAEACEIYARLGDEESIRWCARHYCNMAGLRYFYAHNPNSHMLPYLVQRFVNNAQETLDTSLDSLIDDKEEWLGTLQTLPTFHADVVDFLKLADEAAANPKVEHPCLFLTAAGFLHYLYGRQAEAEDYLLRAARAEGTAAERDNLRAIRLLVSTASKHERADYDSYVLHELRWLEEKCEAYVAAHSTNVGAYPEKGHYFDVMRRVVYHGLLPRYRAEGRTSLALGLQGMLWDEDTPPLPTTWWTDYDYAASLDSLSAAAATAHYEALYAGGETDLERFVFARCSTQADYWNDVIGTKLLREGQWAAAEARLSRVPQTYLNAQSIAPFAKVKRFDVRRWMKRQSMPKGFNWENPGLTENVKVAFCRTMLLTEQAYEAAEGEARYEKALQLANYYLQASYAGDCWFLTQYAQCASDTARNYAPDFLYRAACLLDEAAHTQLPALKAEVTYAQAFLPIEPWRVLSYEKESPYRFIYTLQTGGRQYKALEKLAALSRVQPEPYITRCDVLKKFMRITAEHPEGFYYPSVEEVYGSF